MIKGTIVRLIIGPDTGNEIKSSSMQLTEPLQAVTRTFPNYPMKNSHNRYLKKIENLEVNKEEISTDEIKTTEFRIQ